MNDTILFESAEILGKIHLGLKDIDYLADGFPKDWFYDWSVEKSISKHKKIIFDTKNSNSKYADKIVNACEIKIDLLNEYCDDYLKYSKLTKVNSHGDYNHLQILCDTKQDRIKAIIDFSSAECIPAVWEIIRSYSYGASECSDLKINLKKFKQYIDRYLKQGKLSLFDVSNMAGFYYYNLLRSTYGFNSNSDNLIEFALWRTEFCEYLSRYYKDIDKFLHKEYESIL